MFDEIIGFVCHCSHHRGHSVCGTGASGGRRPGSSSWISAWDGSVWFGSTAALHDHHGPPAPARGGHAEALQQPRGSQQPKDDWQLYLHLLRSCAELLTLLLSHVWSFKETTWIMYLFGAAQKITMQAALQNGAFWLIKFSCVAFERITEEEMVKRSQRK